MLPESVNPPVSGLSTPANVLVAGASSGIGLAMVRELLENSYVQMTVAVSRSATTNDALMHLRAQNPARILLVDADLTDEHDLTHLVATLDTIDELNLVIHAAGLLHRGTLRPEKNIEQLSLHTLQQVFAINAFAPILLARALMPKLCRAQPCVFASLSARVGSIGDNRSGGWYSYRASKAAQNQLLKTFSIELARRNRRATCLLLHPGTVDTPLSKPFQANVPAEKLFEPARTASLLLAIIARSSPSDSGRFIAWDGSDIAW